MKYSTHNEYYEIGRKIFFAYRDEGKTVSCPNCKDNHIKHNVDPICQQIHRGFTDVYYGFSKYYINEKYE